MTSALETIEYLARSDHRVEVLDAIHTSPRTRDEIRELTDASRVTAGRIITDLEERGWIVRNGTEYEATTSGCFVASEFTRLMGNLEAFDDLPPVVEWFPDGQPAFDLHRLEGATVTTADEGDLIAPIRRALDLIDRTEDLQVTGNGASAEFTEAMLEAVEGGATHTMVLSSDAVAAIRTDAELRDHIRSMLETGRATLFQHDGETEVPVMQVGDGTVALCSGDHRAMVETDDEAIYDWAASYFETLRAEATPVPAEEFVEGGAVEERADEPMVE